MGSVAALLDQARAAGVRLRVEGGKLLATGPKPSAELARQLRANRAAIVAALSPKAEPPAAETMPALPLPSGRRRRFSPFDREEQRRAFWAWANSELPRDPFGRW